MIFRGTSWSRALHFVISLSRGQRYPAFELPGPEIATFLNSTWPNTGTIDITKIPRCGQGRGSRAKDIKKRRRHSDLSMVDFDHSLV